jgi:hypothetical protein
MGIFGGLEEKVIVKDAITDPWVVCQEYAHDLKGYGYCVYQNAKDLPDAEGVDRHCSQAGEWQDGCRQAWAVTQVDKRPLEELFRICGSNADCSFEILDTKSHDDVLVQIKRCKQFAGHYAQDCVMHASQRWYFDWPSAEEVARVAQRKTPFPEQVGMYIGARVACDGVGTCDGEKEIQRMCEKYVDIFQDKKNCPNQHRNRKKRK